MSFQYPAAEAVKGRVTKRRPRSTLTAKAA